MFDVLIIGGGVSGMSCALVLGSAKNKSFASDKKIGILTHQKNSSLQEALFNNAYGIAPGKLGSELLDESTAHLSELYPHIIQIPNEKIIEIQGEFPEFTVISNKNTYQTKYIIVGIGAPLRTSQIMYANSGNAVTYCSLSLGRSGYRKK